MKRRNYVFIIPITIILVLSLVLPLTTGTDITKVPLDAVDDCNQKGSIYGRVVYFQACYMQYMKAAMVILKGRATGIEKTYTTVSAGRFIFDELDKDTYKITASKPDYNKSKISVDLKQGRSRLVELELEEEK
jgi:hypothetical protein